MKTIFYSWQSDNKPVRNKLTRALEIVAKQLSSELSEADRPEVDSDTQGTFGSEDIMPIIFSKIDTCSVFVADVTPITKLGDKLIPNPNVMAELGYALKTKNPFTRLYIYCLDEEGKMPFDIYTKNLQRFSSSDKPSDIAKRLLPIIEGMLRNASDTESTKFEIVFDRGGWANWSNIGSGFRYHIAVDNYEGKLDYIEEIYVESNDGQGNPWRTSYFKFDEQNAGQKLEIEERKMKDAQVFLANSSGQNQPLLPDIDQDEACLVIKLRSDGKLRKIKIPPTYLKNFF
jgi:hypothetical protein